MVITTIILFLLILGLIVFVHELGHFFMAKLYGVKVDEFGLGFPPKIYGIKRGETEYTLNWIPLGGFVKIEGEDGGNKKDPRSFSSRSISQRFQILAAGVVMNFFLAFVIFSFIFALGFPQDVTGENLADLKDARDVKVVISQVMEKSPAADAGLAAGDTVRKIGDKDIYNISDLKSVVHENEGKAVSITVSRGSDTFTKEITPRVNPSQEEGAMGVVLAQTAIISYSPMESIKQGYEYTVRLTIFIVWKFWEVVTGLLTTGKTAAEVSGPIGIASMTGQAAALGFMTVLNFIALISVNLAVINALPFPALDGGRLLFLMIEKVKGRPLNQEWEAKANNFGFLLLMLLMVLVTFKDVLKFDLWGKFTGLFG